ncbi:MAG: hypothetical protein QGF59_03315, partial [Pirellulaceae bacterium]|nr:hypothetical protein [Pirellulaceae bacterium]
DGATWTPQQTDGGDFNISAELIDVTAVENLEYDGEGDDETLTVVGDGAGAGTGDTFIHTPGSARDAGNVSIDNGVNTLLGIGYVNLGLAGSVAVDGAGGADVLGALGTDASDVLDVTFTGTDAIVVDLTSTLGNHINLTSSAVENYEINGLEGDDDINLAPTGAVTPLVNASGTFEVLGGGPGSGSDTLNLLGAAATTESVNISPDAANSDDQDITGLGAQIDVTGIELITYTGADADDMLEVELGPGAANARVQGRGNGDVVLSDSLPEIEYSGVDTFQLTAGSQSVVTFVLHVLSGASTYQVSSPLDATTLAVEGVDSEGDNLQITTDGTAISVADLIAGIAVTAIDFTDGFDAIRVNALGGDDTLTVDVDGTPLVDIPVTYDGGDGSDVLNVTGNATGGVTTVEYTPGPGITEGRLTYDGTMTIDFDGLEPVNDNVVAATLIVNGTNADNAINYVAGTTGAPFFVGLSGLVSVDAFETIEFNNKTNLILNGNAGDDVISLNNSTTPASLTGITVNGNDPTASDTLVLNDLDAGNTVTIATATNTVTGAEPVPVIYGTIESISLTTTVPGAEVAFTGSANYTVNPGAETDEGTVLTDNDPPVNFFGYGAGETIDLSAAVANVTINGTGNNDAYVVAANNDVTITGRATVENIAGSTVMANAGNGDDTFTVDGGNTLAVLNVNGGDGDDDDTLDANLAAAAVTVDLDARTVTGFGALINYTGLQTIEADANGQTFQVDGTTGDDTLVVTPLTADTGTVQGNGADPVVEYDNIAGNALTVDGVGGENTIVVNGNELGEIFTVTTSLVSVGGQTVNYLGQALTVNGQQGDDTFDVTPGAIPIFIDGGDPIGVIGDTLNLIANTTSMFSPGPEGDEGGFDIDGLETVSYDHIESISVTDPAGNNLVATVMGTQGADDITAQGQATNAVDVSVNDGPRVSYIGLGTLNLLSKWGDDDITVDVNVASLGVLINVDGSLPTAGSDELRVTGVDGVNDMPSWTPNGAGTGLLALDGQSAIVVAGIETLIYDGEGDDETLTVVGDGVTASTADTLTHTPGSARDAGDVSIDNGTNTLLGIGYINLGLAGSVAVDGGNQPALGADSLTVEGTSNNDGIIVAVTTGTLEHTLSNGQRRVDLLTTNIEDLIVNLGAGADETTINEPQPYASIDVNGGNPDSGSDVLTLNGAAGVTENVTILTAGIGGTNQLIIGLSAPIISSGTELIRYFGDAPGAGADDTLTVNVGLFATRARV